MIILLSLLSAAWRPHVYHDPMGVESPIVVLGAVSLDNDPRAIIQANCTPSGPALYFSAKYIYIPHDTTSIKVSHGAPTTPGVAPSVPPEVKTYAFDRGSPDFGIIQGAPIFSAMIRRPGRTVFQVDGRIYRFDLDASVLAPWYATCVAKGRVPEDYLGEPATTPSAPRESP